MRRQMAWSVPRTVGLWFAARKSLWVGLKLQKSSRMWRARTMSPPVSCFTVASASIRAVLDLLAHGDAPPEEVRDGRRVRVGVLREQEVRRGLQAVVAEQLEERAKERALPVRAGAVKEEEHLLVDAPGERVAHGALKERDELGVAPHDVREERRPPRTLRVRVEGDGCDLRDVVRARVRAKGSRCEGPRCRSRSSAPRGRRRARRR